MKNTPPLIVDLDGTLILTDMLQESALKTLRSPLDLLRIPYWLSKSKAFLKHKLANGFNFDPSLLPYNQSFLDWLQEQKTQGRTLILCTASDATIANTIAEYLGIFNEVMASDGITNLSKTEKASALEKRFGHKGFDYAANEAADFTVWQVARKAIVVNASPSVAKKAANCCEIDKQFPKQIIGLRVWLRVLRAHQWLKNTLLVVPLLASHQFINTALWLPLVIAFFAFSLCASSVYVTNDLLDLESDRQHPRKRKRPFASGSAPLWLGVVLAPILLLASLALAMQVGGDFIPCLLFYFALTCLYSWGLKRLLLVDSITLAILYTLRIIAGAAAINLTLSFWLLAFSVFLFLSLAFVKRYTEMQAQILNGKEKIHGRGYYATDAPLVQMMGITAGYAAVVVLALYLNSTAVGQLYKIPQIIWAAVPIILFWVSWMWIQAHRGKMHDDPLVFAIKDKASLLSGILFAAMLVIGAMGLRW